MITIRDCTTPEELAAFWEAFGIYLRELAITATEGDELDLDYFFSAEYLDAIEALRTRQRSPLHLSFFQKNGIPVGFAMYIIYLEEDGKGFILEYNIDVDRRNAGRGSMAYTALETHMRKDGCQFIELTPTNAANARFWARMGYGKTDQMDEDGKHIWRKALKS